MQMPGIGRLPGDNSLLLNVQTGKMLIPFTLQHARHSSSYVPTTKNEEYKAYLKT